MCKHACDSYGVSIHAHTRATHQNLFFRQEIKRPQTHTNTDVSFAGKMTGGVGGISTTIISLVTLIYLWLMLSDNVLEVVGRLGGGGQS